MGLAKLVVNFGRDQVFFELGTSGHEDLIMRIDLRDLDQFFRVSVVPIGFDTVEFYAAGNNHVFRIATETTKAFGVDFVLGRDNRKSPERTADQPMESSIATKAVGAQATINNRDRDTSVVCGSNQVRPNFQFSQDKHPGTNSFQHPLNGPGEIQRTKKRVVLRKLLGSQVKSGFGGRGDYEFKIGMPALELFENWIKQVDFADADCVEPDAGAGGSALRDEPQYLVRPATSVFSRGKGPPQQPW